MSLHARRTTALATAALGAALLCLAPASASAGTKAIGIDVSRFQGAIDWPAVAGSGIRFAFVQASRGSGADCTVKPGQCGADPYFAANRLAAETAGIRVGAYHRAFASGGTVADARADAIAECDVFLSAVGSLKSGELVPVIDVETPFTGMTSTSLRAWIRLFVKRTTKHLGRKPMIYTNASSWAATGNTREFAKARYPLWIAEYGVSRPTVPRTTRRSARHHGVRLKHHGRSGTTPSAFGYSLRRTRFCTYGVRASLPRR
jgi:GH25 family lysozyme M1 (1,4-beta-N-acetylmuramidase)